MKELKNLIVGEYETYIRFQALQYSINDILSPFTTVSFEVKDQVYHSTYRPIKDIVNRHIGVVLHQVLRENHEFVPPNKSRHPEL